MAYKKYGDYNDPENKYVKMIPYWFHFRDKKSISSRKSYFLTLVDLASFGQQHFDKSILELEGQELLSLNNLPAKKDAGFRIVCRKSMNTGYNHPDVSRLVKLQRN